VLIVVEMPISRAKKAEMVRRRSAAGDLCTRGYSQVAIAEELGVSQSTVCTDLQIIHKQWRESAIRDFDSLRERELRKLDALEFEAWKAWQRSQKPSQEAVVTTDGTTQRTQKKVAEQVGDVRFLEQVSKCIASRRALLGLDAPTKIAPTSPDGEQAYHAHVMAELMRLAEHSLAGPEVIDCTFIEGAAQSKPLSGLAPGQVADADGNGKPHEGTDAG
jgi:transposase